MPKKIILGTSHFRPGTEAMSGEIQILQSALQRFNIAVEIFERSPVERAGIWFFWDLARHWRKSRAWLRNPNICIHVFATSRHQFLRFLFAGSPRTLLTLIETEYLTQKYARALARQYRLIVVESDYDKEKLINLGCSDERIILARPFSAFEDDYDSTNSAALPTGEKMKLLLASMPYQTGDFSRRGLDIVLETAKTLALEIEITMACRSMETYNKLNAVTQEKNLNNIRLIEPWKCDMLKEMTETHAVVLSHRYRAKSCPNSLIEALSLGRPVLVSKSAQFGNIVSENRCGDIFEPNSQDLINAIQRLQDNYTQRQSQTRKTYEALFSKSSFLKAYSTIYSLILHTEIQLS